MTALKDLFMEIEGQTEHDFDENSVEVYADSVKQALELASKDMGVDITMLDYEIIEKGTKGFFGIGRQPYRVLVTPVNAGGTEGGLEELERKLSGDHIPGINIETKQNINSTFKIRITKSGIWFILTPPKGKGHKVELDEVNNKLYSMRITNSDSSIVEKEVLKSSGKPVKIGEWIPNPAYDSKFSIEVSEDEMKAFVHFEPPRFTGRHLELDEVLDELKGAGVVSGLKEDMVNEYLENMDYNHPLLAAEGQKPQNGRDAYVDYKIRIDKSSIKFEEDESGKVDFRNLELLENVVVGQLLAVKIPSEEGLPGRTVINRILPARTGKDIAMQCGKGTILSADGMELTAETNGQVVFKAGKLHVEPVYVVNGDVSLATGNIVFLGSVIVSGNVQDNFVVKAAGNIEVKGTVQKAFLEAEGDIIVHQGISGREEAKIESTGGSIFAKFIQNANIVAENDVIVPEGILHSNVDAGERIYCIGRRARIVGGLIRAGSEVNARLLGAEVSTKTEIKVGINPKVLQQINELESLKEKNTSDLKEIQLNLKTLENQKKVSRISEEKQKMLSDLKMQGNRITERLEDVSLELEELNSYIGMLEHKGQVCAEKSVFSGVDIYIKDQIFPVKDIYNFIKFSLEGGEIRLSEYEPPVFVEGQKRISTLVRRR